MDQSWHFLSFVCVDQYISIKCNQSDQIWVMFSPIILRVGSLEVDRCDELDAELRIYDEKVEVVMGPMRGPYRIRSPLMCKL